ncbi:hypothetical protein WJX84_010336 [Apatococcus fuscideae]|uniref:MOSC domain-containing protein n=1 Tax=Apatococcus fuscideae TaxID=2026836 RepID=A0AAW1STJ1_9CHLO
MQSSPESVAALEKQLGAGGTQALLTTLQSLSRTSATPLLRQQNRDLYLSLQILLRQAGQGHVTILPSLLTLQDFPIPVFQPLPASTPNPPSQPGWEVDAEEELPAALEESGDSADEADEDLKAPANTRMRPSAQRAVQLLDGEVGCGSNDTHAHAMHVHLSSSCKIHHIMCFVTHTSWLRRATAPAAPQSAQHWPLHLRASAGPKLLDCSRQPGITSRPSAPEACSPPVGHAPLQVVLSTPTRSSPPCAGLWEAKVMTKVSSLMVYPVKGCKGTSLSKALVTATGFLFDRNWMVVTADKGRFVTQRNCPKLALVDTKLPLDLLSGGATLIRFEDCLTLEAPGCSPLQIPLQQTGDPVMKNCICWEWRGEARDEGDEAAAWLSGFLSMDVRLVRYAGTPDSNAPGQDKTRRSTDARFAPDNEVAFADGFPFLIASEGGLETLNEQLDEKVPMNRFRPNIVTDDQGKFPEDEMESFQIQGNGRPGIDFLSVSPCARCKVTTVNQSTAETGKEPLRTLKGFRGSETLQWTREKDWKGQGFFGWNLVPQGAGVIAVGDSLHLKKSRDLAALAA